MRRCSYASFAANSTSENVAPAGATSSQPRFPAATISPRSATSWEKIAQTLSWINAMAYDIHGPWHGYTAFNSPFETDPADPIGPRRRPGASVTGTVEFFLSHGVPAWKLVVGIPLYGRQYAQVPNVDDGLYQPFDNAGMDGSSWELSEAPTYHELVDIGRVMEPQSGWTRHWSESAKVPWLYKPGASNDLGTFISYDDADFDRPARGPDP